MSKPTSLKDYREAKTILPDVINILRVVNLAIKALEFYKSYLPVMKMLNVLREQKTLLELHQSKYKEVTKGK